MENVVDVSLLDRPLVVDVHCHICLSARRATLQPRFSFERDGAQAADGQPGYESYMSPRMLRRPTAPLLRRMLGVPHAPPSEAFDESVLHVTLRQAQQAESVDRIVLLAFDEYYDADGRALPPATHRRQLASEVYTSNTLVHALVRDHPDEYLFGASIHPYRTHEGRSAVQLLDEVAAAGAVLIKWLPIVMNIDARDPRTVAFLRRAAELHVPLLIHYGGEKALTEMHPEFADPRPLLQTLRVLRADGTMPTVIVAHFATASSWPLAPLNYFEPLMEALLGEFADAPLYSDTSALAFFTRARYLKRLLRRPEVLRKLVHGSDFPIPITPVFFVRQLGLRAFSFGRHPSWIERDYQIKRALGLTRDDMTRAWDVLAGSLQRRFGRAT